MRVKLQAGHCRKPFIIRQERGLIWRMWEKAGCQNAEKHTDGSLNEEDPRSPIVIVKSDLR